MSHKKSAKNVTADPDLAAWCAALASPPVTDVVPLGWFTIQQLSATLRKPRPTICRLVTEATAAGRCETVRFRVTTGSVTRPVAHYKLSGGK